MNHLFISLEEIKPGRATKPLKKQRTLLKLNETVYHDKVPISTRFYLQLLKKSQFLQRFIDNETYDYASEGEKPVTSPEAPRRAVKKENDRTTYNLRFVCFCLKIPQGVIEIFTEFHLSRCMFVCIHILQVDQV